VDASELDLPSRPRIRDQGSALLDLYHRQFEDDELGDDEFVISADEKTSIQARRRCHPTIPAGPRRPMLVEHEYDRAGTWAYIAAWDVHRAKIFGRLERKTGLQPFDRLVAEVMGQEPYRSARPVFWVIDNGSSHRGEASVRRLRTAFPTLVPVHLPIHASWLNQVESYFSILLHKVDTPADAASAEELAANILAFQEAYEAMAKPFEWKFTRADLKALLKRLAAKEVSELGKAA